MKAYMGKLLRVNLTEGQISIEPLNTDYARDFIGGTGLGIRLAYNEVPPETDALSPEAKMFFMTGPITATSLGTTGRYQVIFKSPLTGILCDCSSSGFWGAELKRSGYDGLIIEGASDSPVYLYINDGKAEIRDAARHWGKDALSIQNDLQEEVGEPKARVVAIGPAGEKGVLYACLINDESRAAARGGPGAVMGSKNLKAIVVRGTGNVELADPEAYDKTAMDINRRNGTDEGIADFRKYGTPIVMDINWAISDIPVKNWALPSTEEMCTPLGGEKMLKIMPKRPKACYRCSLGCARHVKIPDGPYEMDAGGPEYETLAALGSMCMIKDLEAISYASHLCNEYGMDTISCGATIAFAMECFEKGLLTRTDTDGIELTWGNKEALFQAIKKIGNNEGMGRLLAIGTRNLANKLGGGSIDFAVQVKGLELPMHDPRAGFAWASTYATSPRGGCHLHGQTDAYEESEDPIPEWGFVGKYTRLSNTGKAEMTHFAQNWGHIRDSLVMCQFYTYVMQPSDFCNLLNNATGWDLKPMDLMEIGDRINALYRAYNNRCGIGRKDDTLPPRVMTPLAEGGAAGHVPDLEGQLEKYYQLRSWEADGKPSHDKLIELGLEDAAGDLYSD